MEIKAKVVPSLYCGKDKWGDWEWMNVNPAWAHTLFVFNDNEEQFNAYLAGAAFGYSAGAGTSTQGWIAGKADGAPNTNVQRITYATDTATASVRGPLSVDVFFLAASTDDTTYGWWGGGLPATSVVQRITYATDTVTASLKVPLTAAKYGAAASSGQQ